MSGILRKFEVDVIVEVYARNEEHAQRLADNMLDSAWRRDHPTPETGGTNAAWHFSILEGAARDVTEEES